MHLRLNKYASKFKLSTVPFVDYTGLSNLLLFRILIIPFLAEPRCFIERGKSHCNDTLQH